MTFQPDTSIPAKVPVNAVHIDKRLANEVKNKAAALNLTRRELLEQMVRHCLKELG